MALPAVVLTRGWAPPFPYLDRSQGETACDLPTFAVNRPCYLVDLTSTAASQTVNFRVGPAPMINGNAFADSSTYLASMPVRALPLALLDSLTSARPASARGDTNLRRRTPCHLACYPAGGIDH